MTVLAPIQPSEPRMSFAQFRRVLFLSWNALQHRFMLGPDQLHADPFAGESWQTTEVMLPDYRCEACDQALSLAPCRPHCTNPSCSRRESL